MKVRDWKQPRRNFEVEIEDMRASHHDETEALIRDHKNRKMLMEQQHQNEKDAMKTDIALLAMKTDIA